MQARQPIQGALQDEGRRVLIDHGGAPVLKIKIKKKRSEV
jgi:hypothetical protein